MLKKLPALIIEETKLNGRPEGSRVRENILRVLEGAAQDTILPLNFSNVEFLDYSCADEILCRTIRRILSRELGEKFIVVEALKDSIKENIQMALKERELVCIFVNFDNSVEILGKLSDELKNTYFAAVEKGKITARDVFDMENMQNISAASNRVTKLNELGLLTKSKDEAVLGGGRQFVYEPIR